MGAIRLFLALAVVQSHVYSHFLAPAKLYVNNKLALGMNGGYAVMFFFVISGFLISFVLEQKYDRPGGTAAFYKARALRIYPLWWALYLIVPFVTADGLWSFIAHRHLYDVLTGFFIYGSDWLLSFWTYPHGYTVPMPHGLELGWTLASEMTFYLIAPFVLRSKALPVVILGASILLRMIVNIAIPQHANPDAWTAWCYYFFPSTVMFFMLGHFTRQLYKRIVLPQGKAWIGLGLVVLVLLIQDAHYDFENVGFYLAILMFAVCLPAIFEATKDNRICNFLGDLTYPLYLSHGVMIALLETKGSVLYAIGQSIFSVDFGLPRYAEAATKATFISVTLWCIAILIAIAVHFFIEGPAIKCMRAVLAQFERRPVAAVPSPAE